MSEAKELKRIEKVVFACPHCGNEVKMPETKSILNPAGWASARPYRKRHWTMSRTGRKHIAEAMKRVWADKTPGERMRWVIACNRNKPHHYKIK